MTTPMHVNDEATGLLGMSILNCFFELKEFRKRMNNLSLNYNIREMSTILSGMYNSLIQFAILQTHVKKTVICLETITKLSKIQRSKLC
jgi:hypothetical protein